MAASAGDVGADGVVRRPWDNDSEKATPKHRSSIHQEYSPSGEKSTDVQRGINHPRFGPESERLFSGVKPSGADTGRKKGRHGKALSSTNERPDGGIAEDEGFDRLVNGSLVSSLISTETEGEGSYFFRANRGGDISFEEGSSEGELSQESEGGMR